MNIRIRDHEYYTCVPSGTEYNFQEVESVCNVCAWQILHEFGHHGDKKNKKCQYCQRLPWTIVKRTWESKDARERDPAFRKYKKLSRASVYVSSGSA